MIGNDMVDLAQAKIDSNWRRSRWMDKVFLRREIELIETSQDQDQLVWRLWSMKESAYKCQVQQGIYERFNPKHFKCRLLDERNGLVSGRRVSYYTKTESSEDYVYTTASLEVDQDIFSRTKRIASNLLSQATVSKDLKEGLLKALSTRLKCETKDLRIKKSAQSVPRVFHGNQNLNIPISFSHHGRYGAFAISE